MTPKKLSSILIVSANPSYDEAYVLTVPADTPITASGWKSLGVITASHATDSRDEFDPDKKLVVTVSSTNGFKLTASGITDTVSYSVMSGDNAESAVEMTTFEFTAAEINKSGGTSKPIGVNVTDYSGLNLSAGDYVDDIIYNVAVENAASESTAPTVGGTWTFGTYNNVALTWRVLAVDEDNKRALLITVYALENRAYHSSNTSITWEGCTLRSWLNGDFLNNFTSDEQSKIATVTNTNPNNPAYGSSGGNDTADKMFLLSIAEADSYFTDDEDRRCTLLSDNDNNDKSWWLRLPGYSSHDAFAACVYDRGSVSVDGYNVDDSAVGVRPAFWLKY